MLEMVEARRNANQVEDRYDLFSGLLDAARGEAGSEAALSDEELLGRSQPCDRSAFLEASYLCFQETCLSFFLVDMRCDLPFLPVVLPQNSFLQTTAHTLCFTFALLALYPDEQEHLYQHVKGAMSSLDGMPVSLGNFNLYGELTPP